MINCYKIFRILVFIFLIKILLNILDNTIYQKIGIYISI